MTTTEILHDEKTWNDTFAKYPFDEYQERVILRAMEEYAQEATKNLHKHEKDKAEELPDVPKSNFQDYGNDIALRICENCNTTVKKGESEICKC